MKSTLIIPICLILVFPVFSVAHAAPLTGSTNTGGSSLIGGTNTGKASSNITLINPLGAGTNLMTLLGQILSFVVNIGSIIIILMLVYVGFKFVVAQGSETKLTEAKKALLWTVVGALILLGAEAISIGIQATVSALSVGG